MTKTGFGYISFLIILFITINIVYTVSYLTIRHHQIIQNCYHQYKSSKLAESGINYYQELTPTIPKSYRSGRVTTKILLNLPCLTYTFAEGNFKLLLVNESLFAIGNYQDSYFIYTKGAKQWYQFVE